MEIQISVQNDQKALALLEFLKSFQIIDTFKVLEGHSPKKNIQEGDVSFFDKFYGSVQELDISEFENYLKNSRNEWERPVF